MDFQFFFRKMETSEPLKTLAQRKLSDRLSKYVGNPDKIHLTFYLDGTQHTIHCSIAAPGGGKVFAEASSDSMYSAIDVLCTKIEAQLHRYKSKRRAKHRRSHWSTPVFFNGTGAFSLDDSIDASDIIKLEAAIKPLRERYLH